MDTPWGGLADRQLRALSMAEIHDYLTRRRRSRRSFLRGLASSAALGAAGPLLWRQTARAATAPPSAVHLAFGRDARTEMVVSWKGAPGTLLVDRGVDGIESVAGSEPLLTGSGHPTPYFRALVDGLTPGETYPYRVVNELGESGGAMTPAPDPTSPSAFRFTAFGDMGVAGRTSTADDPAAVMAVLARQEPDLNFFVGDLCYAYRTGGLTPSDPTGRVVMDEHTWDDWLDLMSAVGASSPWMCTVGNHEMEPGYGPLGYDGFTARVHVPVGSALPTVDLSGELRVSRLVNPYDTDHPAPPVYAFQYGNVGFVALDANDASYEIDNNRGYLGAGQDEWLRETLAAMRSAESTVDFVVVGFHHCAYCTNAVHGSDDGVRRRWQPLFDEFTVDLVVNGHNHSYERTHPLRRSSSGLGAEIVQEAPPPSGPEADPVEVDSSRGTTYITAGGGGQATYPTVLHPLSTLTVEGNVRVPEDAAWSAARVPDHSLISVDVHPDGGSGRPVMDVAALDTAGAVIDRVVLSRG